MSEIFTGAKRQAVYYQCGKFKDQQAPRFVKAPFDIIEMSSGHYLVPVWQSSSSCLASAQLDSLDAETRRLWREDFAYHTLNPVVVSEHEMGDLSNKMDKAYGNWKSVHAFGMI